MKSVVSQSEKLTATKILGSGLIIKSKTIASWLSRDLDSSGAADRRDPLGDRLAVSCFDICWPRAPQELWRCSTPPRLTPYPTNCCNSNDAQQSSGTVKFRLVNLSDATPPLIQTDTKVQGLQISMPNRAKLVAIVKLSVVTFLYLTLRIFMGPVFYDCNMKSLQFIKQCNKIVYL